MKKICIILLLSVVLLNGCSRGVECKMISSEANANQMDELVEISTNDKVDYWNGITYVSETAPKTAEAKLGEDVFSGEYEYSICAAFNKNPANYYIAGDGTEFALEVGTDRLVYVHFTADKNIGNNGFPNEDEALDMAICAASEITDLGSYTTEYYPAANKYGRSEVRFVKYIDGMASWDRISVLFNVKGILSDIIIGEINAFDRATESKMKHLREIDAQKAVSDKLFSGQTKGKLRLSAVTTGEKTLVVTPKGELAVVVNVTATFSDENQTELSEVYTFILQ